MHANKLVELLLEVLNCGRVTHLIDRIGEQVSGLLQGPDGAQARDRDRGREVGVREVFIECGVGERGGRAGNRFGMRGFGGEREGRKGGRDMPGVCSMPKARARACASTSTSMLIALALSPLCSGGRGGDELSASSPESEVKEVSSSRVAPASCSSAWACTTFESQ